MKNDVVGRLRRKMALIIAGLVTGVFIGLLATVYYMSEWYMYTEIEGQMMEIVREGRLSVPGFPDIDDGNKEPDGHLSEDPQEDHLDEEHSDGDYYDPHSKARLYTMLMITIDGDSVRLSGGQLFKSLDDRTVEYFIAQVRDGKHHIGYFMLDDVSYVYVKSFSNTPEHQIYLIHDDHYETTELSYLLRELLIIGILGIIGIVVLSIVLARWAVHPTEKTFEAQRRFVADASHELKTPLAVIMADQSILAENPDATIREQKKWVDSIREEGQQMQELIGNLLYLARSDAGALNGDLESVNLSDLVLETALQFDALIFESGKSLDLQIDPDLGICGEAQQIETLVRNLLDNALKYSDEHGRITLRLVRNGERVNLFVHNTGSYLTREECEHIFDRFYRADESRSQTGYGLGLSMVSAIAQSHQAKIKVNSDRTEGTEFMVSFPLLHQNQH